MKRLSLTVCVCVLGVCLCHGGGSNSPVQLLCIRMKDRVCAAWHTQLCAPPDAGAVDADTNARLPDEGRVKEHGRPVGSLHGSNSFLQVIERLQHRLQSVQRCVGVCVCGGGTNAPAPLSHHNNSNSVDTLTLFLNSTPVQPIPFKQLLLPWQFIYSFVYF